jgi:hypothetical protein
MTLLSEAEYRKALAAEYRQLGKPLPTGDDFFLDARMRQQGQSMVLNFPWGPQRFYVAQ